MPNRILYIVLLLLLPLVSLEDVQADTYTKGKSRRLLELESSSLRMQRFVSRRYSYTPQYDDLYKYRVALDWDLSILKYGFWRNEVHTEGLTNGIVKTVGWHFFLGFRVPQLGLEFFHEHHSEHVMDSTPIEDSTRPGQLVRFPVEDSYGVRFKLYER